MRKLRLLLPILLIPVLALAACGGGDGGGDEDKVVETIETLTLSTDPADCKELATLHYLEQTEFREGKAALKSCVYHATRTAGGEGDVESVEVSNVEIDGSEATAEVAFQGGLFDGQAFSVLVVEEDGNWKMGEITGFAEFDHAKFAQSIEGQIEEDAGGLPPETLSCVGKEFREMSRGELEELVTAGRAQPLQEVVTGCI